MLRGLLRTARVLGLGLVALVVLVGCAHVWNGRADGVPPKAGGTLRLASHNVHYIILSRDTGPWSVGDWETRKPALDAAFKALDADVVAFQEMESFQRGSDASINLARDWLLSQNPGYALAAHGDWRRFPTTQPIFYRPDALRLRDQGWFFFSTTPDVIYSRTFNGSWPAFASWAEFEASQGTAFRVYNVHTDYSSRENRAKSAVLIRDRVAPVVATGMPVVVLGDFNVPHGWDVMDTIAEAGLSFPRVRGTTYHLNRGANLFGAIDHIGVTPDLPVAGGPYVLRRSYGGVWPSDHYPIAMDLSLR